MADPDVDVDVMQTMNTPEDKVWQTLDMESKEKFEELRHKMIEAWEGRLHAEYFDHIGVDKDSVRGELEGIALNGGCDEPATVVSGRLLLNSGIEKIPRRHYMFFTEIMKFLGKKSIEKGQAVGHDVKMLEESGVLGKIMNRFKGD